MTNKPTILAVEDDDEWHDLWARALGDNVNYLKATTLEGGFATFAEYSNEISLVLMDACVPGLTPTTIPLIQKIRETFTGPIIGCSSSLEYRKELRKAGCSHDVDKSDTVKMVSKILNFQL